MAVNSGWTVYAPILIVFLVAVFSFFAVRRAIAPDGWYNYVRKATYNPPNWLFGIVWLILYFFIAFSWVRANSLITDQATFDLVNWLFIINIILNLAWSFLFFGDGNLIAGLIIIVLMLVTVCALIYLLRFDAWAFSFMILYFLSLVLTFCLNFHIVKYNYIIGPPFIFPILSE